MSMTQKVYKTAQGKVLDMGKITLQNEKIRAVGNMKVNARGDEVDDMNNVIRSKPAQVNTQYDRQVTNPRKK
jgi:hypothetical protein